MHYGHATHIITPLSLAIDSVIITSYAAARHMARRYGALVQRRLLWRAVTAALRAWRWPLLRYYYAVHEYYVIYARSSAIITHITPCSYYGITHMLRKQRYYYSDALLLRAILA